MKTVNYTKEGNSVLSAMDGVIVRKHIAGLAGGRALDMTDYTAKVVPCGLPIITDGNGNYKPLAPTNGFVLPAGYTYAGLCGATVLAGDPVSVIVAGVINWVAMLTYIKEVLPTPDRVLTKDDLAAIKSALPHIIFENDEAGDVTSTTITDVVYIDSQEDFTAYFDKLADYYEKNPDAEGHDGTWPGMKWAVANYSGLAGTMVIAYDGTEKATIPGITTSSTYVIVDPLPDLGIAYESFNVSKLTIKVTI